MSRPRIITGLDIGSGVVKILSAFKKPGKEDFEIVGQAEEPSFGVRKGVVVDVAKTAEIISLVWEKNEIESNHKISGVYAGLGGSHLSCSSSHGLVSVSRADRKISEEDVDRVIQAAKTFSLPSNKEVIDIFPKEFIVDDQQGIKEPVGMEGVRLEADVSIICCFSPYLKNLSRAILNSGLQVNDLVPNSLASSRAALTSKEKELGVVNIDIGAGTTGVCIFEEGCLIGAAVFPVGSANITNDIAVCLKTDIDTAEKIKIEFGACRAPRIKGIRKKKAGAGSKKSGGLIKIESEEPLVFSQKALSEIIEARVKEIFELANKELKAAGRQGKLPGGVVLTGGGAKLPGIREFAKKELKLPCRIGFPQGFPEISDDPSLATLCGLIIQGSENEEEQGNYSLDNIKYKIKRIFKAFIP